MNMIFIHLISLNQCSAWHLKVKEKKTMLILSMVTKKLFETAYGMIGDQ